jgi:hypothetical protein
MHVITQFTDEVNSKRFAWLFWGKEQHVGVVAGGVQSTALAFAAGPSGAWCFASEKGSNRNCYLLFP